MASLPTRPPVELHTVKLGRILWLRTDKLNSRGTCPVSLRLTLPGHKHADLSTGISCRPADWQGTAGNESPLKKTHLDHESDTHTLDVLRVNVKIAQQRLEALGHPVTPQVVAQLLKNPKALQPGPAPCLLEFMEAELETHYRPGNRGTYESQRGIVAKLRGWAGPGRLPVEALTAVRVQAFYRQLLATKARGGEIVSANKVVTHLIGMYRRGIKQALWSEAQNPFAALGLKPAPRKVKVRLTKDELAAVRELSLAPTEWLWRARAAHLVQFFLRGERIGACLLLRWSDVRAHGSRIDYQSQKGGPFKQVPVRAELGNLLACLRRYYPDRSFVLPYLPDTYDRLDAEAQLTEIKKATALINKALKKIVALAGVDKQLTTHAARRTFATLGRKAVGVAAVQGMLGHTTERQTQKYLDELDFDGQDAAADAIFDSL